MSIISHFFREEVLFEISLAVEWHSLPVFMHGTGGKDLAQGTSLGTFDWIGTPVRDASVFSTAAHKYSQGLFSKIKNKGFG
jgi:hypothetical protein